jgi:hypothetical protein
MTANSKFRFFNFNIIKIYFINVRGGKKDLEIFKTALLKKMLAIRTS